jgi:hypothetical protein
MIPYSHRQCIEADRLAQKASAEPGNRTSDSRTVEIMIPELGRRYVSDGKSFCVGMLMGR